MCCLAITQENEAKVVQTRIYQEFPDDDGIDVEVFIYGLIFVPGSAVIGLVKCSQATESRIPYIQFMTNDWFSRRETSNFLENACLKGQFKSGYSAAKDAAGSGNEVEAKTLRAVLGPRDSGRHAS